VGSGGAIARHNRAFIPSWALSSVVRLDSRTIVAAGAGETLRISLVDQAGVVFPVADEPIGGAGAAWQVNRQFAVPPSVPRGRSYMLQFQVVSSGTPVAVIGLDNIDVLIPPRRAGDINQDGCVNVSDLLGVIAAWGSCPPAPAACAADTDGNGQVNVADLLAVIATWGCS